MLSANRPFASRRPLVVAAMVGCLMAPAAWACNPINPIEAANVQVPYVGQIVQAYSCKDREGLHYYLATSVAVEGVDPGQAAAEVHFYKYTQATNGALKRWEARDFVPGGGPGIRIKSFEMADRDRDGTAEAYISYELTSPAAGNDEGKLLVFYKDKKHAIRGSLARLPADYASRNLDATFASLPSSVQSHALGLWDNLSLPQTRVR